MGGNIGEIQLESERELYKYINHYAVVKKASCKIILVQVYIIFALLNINVIYSVHVCNSHCILHLLRKIRTHLEPRPCSFIMYFPVHFR